MRLPRHCCSVERVKKVCERDISATGRRRERFVERAAQLTARRRTAQAVLTSMTQWKVRAWRRGRRTATRRVVGLLMWGSRVGPVVPLSPLVDERPPTVDEATAFNSAFLGLTWSSGGAIEQCNPFRQARHALHRERRIAVCSSRCRCQSALPGLLHRHR